MRDQTVPALLDAIGIGIVITRTDGSIEFANETFLAWLPHTTAEGAGTAIWELLRSPDGGLPALHAAVLAGRHEHRTRVHDASRVFMAEAVLKRLDGTDGARVVWSLVAAEPARSAPELALWGTQIGLWDWDVTNDRLTWINDWCEHTQVTAYSGSGHEKLWSQRIHPDDLPAYTLALNRPLEGQTQPYDVDYRLSNRDNTWVWIQERGRVVERDAEGRARRVVGLCLDVEERHRVMRSLERSEARFAHAVWGTSVGFWDLDLVTDTLHWWNDWCALLEIEPCEGVRHSVGWSANVHPDDRAEFAVRQQALIVGEVDEFEAEYRIRTRTGRWRWIVSRSRATARDCAGRALGLSGVTFDIDERKRMELALRDTEARLEAAVWGVDFGLWDWRVADECMLWLSDWPLRYAIDCGSRAMPRALWLACLHPDDRPGYLAEEHALLTGRCESADRDYRVAAAAPQWRWVNMRTRVIERDAAGRALRMVGACIEVDARRRAEQLLQTQAQILETMSEGVVLIDRRGRVEFTNPAFDRMFGPAAGERAAQFVFNVIQRQQLSDRDAQSSDPAAGRPRHPRHSIAARRADGTEMATEVVSAQIDNGAESRVLIVAQDVSERKQLEAQIIDIANHERSRLAGDLHDGIGQELTGISLMLRGLATRGSQSGLLPPEADMEAIIGLVNHAIQSVRQAAHGISPIMVERGGLVSALEALAARTRAAHRRDVRFRLRMTSPPCLDEAAANHLYLIAQEAVANALKHGAARTVRVELRADGTLVDLSISDDGRGIPDLGARGAGMGIKIMEYRAAMIGGQLVIRRGREGGTRVRCLRRKSPARGGGPGIRA